MKYIDIHCHLDSKDFDSDRDEVFVRMKEKEIRAVTIGADLESSKRAVEIAEANENVWACIGVHPEIITSPRSASQSDPLLEAGEGKNSSLPLHLGEGQLAEGKWDEVKFEKLVKSPKVVGIGECGLDYFRLSGDVEEEKNKQKALFIQQIQFAIKHDKPLMLHCREAYGDVLKILKNYKRQVAEKLRGNVHFFAGNIEVAQKFLDLDFTMSFTGVITFTNDYDEVIMYVPNNSIMAETDAPWVAPAPFRGKRNEPVYVIEVIKKIAEIRGEDFDILNNTIIENFRRVFLAF